MNVKLVTMLRVTKETTVNTSQPVNISLVTNTTKYNQKTPYHFRVSAAKCINTEEVYITI